MLPNRLRLAASLILCLAAGSAGQARAARMQADAGMGGAMGPQAASPADAQMKTGMQHMQTGMQDAKLTGNADHDFVSMMLVHHEGAVSMARVELQHGKDPSLLRLARAIIASQQKEIDFMKGWLASHPAANGTAP